MDIAVFEGVNGYGLYAGGEVTISILVCEVC